MKKPALADVFEEWKKRFDADPNAFQDCVDFKDQDPETYGEAAAIYFTWLEKEMTHG